MLEDLLQTEIVGFRAPYFSLTKETKWVSGELAELGFEYSSSVLPAKNAQAGFPEAPRSPFLWPSGLIELPVTTFGIGYLRAPIIGGAYLRLSLRALVAAATFQAARNDFGMTYCHPYDFDDQEPFTVREGDSWIFSKLLFARRKLMLKRVMSVVSPGSRSLAQLIKDPAMLAEIRAWDTKC